MKTRTLKNTRVNIVTLGCSKNLVDSENLLTQLRGNGIDAHHELSSDEANVIIVNTCGFIDNAKQESVDTILRYASAKQEGMIDKLYVTGCLSERYKADFEKEIPEVDAFFGTRDMPLLLKRFKADYRHELVGERLLTTPQHYAYLKISEGCDRPCSFCAIPLMRGGHVSRPEDDILAEARGLAARGTKELILIAQDLTYYGIDLYKERRVATLLRKLSDVEGIDWIRLQYAYPSGFPMDILDAMNSSEKICKYLDMPLQHISDNMLKIMRRGITKNKTMELVKQIRDRVPGIALRTTMLIGHPGEKEEDFGELMEFVENTRFERLGVFTYSHEEKTHAGETMSDDVPETLKKDRADKVMSLQAEISAQQNLQKIGKTYKVLIDRKESGYFVGRTAFDSPEVDNEVLIDAENQYIRIGDFVDAKIIQSSEFDLWASVVI